MSIKFLLNCAGPERRLSCHGGSATRANQYIKDVAGYAPFDTCQPYIACSSDSSEGFRSFVDTSCRPEDIYSDCFDENCAIAPTTVRAAQSKDFQLRQYWNTERNKAEIHARGPVKASVNAAPLFITMVESFVI